MLQVREKTSGPPVAPDPAPSKPPRRRRPVLLALGTALVVLLVAASVAAITWKPSGAHSTDRVTVASPSPAIVTDQVAPAEVPTTVVAGGPNAAPLTQAAGKPAVPLPAGIPQQPRSRPAPACTLPTGYPVTIPEAMTIGPDGALWFTQPGIGRIGRLTLAGAYSSFPVPGVPGDQNGIAAWFDGALWFSEANAIGRISTSGDVKSYPLPNGARPGRITVGPDGALWFVEINRGFVGRITSTGDFHEIALPGGQAAKGIVAGPDGAVWVTRGDIFRLTPAGEASEYPLAQFSQDNVQPEAATGGIVTGRDGAIWFITKYALHRMTVDGHDAIASGGPDTKSAYPPQTDLAVDGNGDFWISTIAGGGSQGIVQRAPGLSPQNVQPAKGYPGDVPAAIATGPDGAAWVGTSPSTTKGAPYGPASILRLNKNGTTVVKALPCPS